MRSWPSPATRLLLSNKLAAFSNIGTCCKLARYGKSGNVLFYNIGQSCPSAVDTDKRQQGPASPPTIQIVLGCARGGGEGSLHPHAPPAGAAWKAKCYLAGRRRGAMQASLPRAPPFLVERGIVSSKGVGRGRPEVRLAKCRAGSSNPADLGGPESVARIGSRHRASAASPDCEPKAGMADSEAPTPRRQRSSATFRGDLRACQALPSRSTRPIASLLAYPVTCPASELIG